MRLNFSNKEKVLVRVILVVALIFAAISFVQNGGLTGFVPSENRTNSLPVWTGNDTWQTGKNSAFAVDLNNFFSDTDSDTLTYLATAADKIDVSVQDNLLTVTPTLDFVGERTIVILASDEFDAVRVNVKIIVGTEEERALSPAEEILNESSNVSQPDVLNTTVSSENVSLETEENTTVKTFDVNEKIKDENNKDVGKKLVDEIAFETFFTSIEKNESGMQVVFYHNSTSQQPVWVEGNVEYVLSSTVAQPFENISLFVPRIEGIIPKFKLHIGISSDVFEFGKTIPDIVFDGNSALIDRDDEKIDVLLSKGDASADIRGAYDVPAITAKVSAAEEAILKTDVFAAESMPIDNATISLLKKGRVTAVMECPEFNILTDACAGEWIKADIPFAENETHITFTVTHFSGYAGADINVINLQSYPAVGRNWVVEFNTTGTANLTITAVNGTTWTDYADSGYDLKFLELKCGDTVQSYSWTGSSVFIQDYNCSSLSIETSKVLTEGRHSLEFRFGDDVAYANNFASSWWYYNFDSTYDDYGRAVDFDAAGNVLIGGYGEYLTTPANLYEWFIIKRNSTTTIWNKSITKDTWGAIYGLAVDLLDNVIVAGDAGAYDNATVAKYNSTGTLLWSRNLQMTSAPNKRAAFYDVALDSDNNITVVGFTDDVGTPAMIFKLNSTGTHLWNVTGLIGLRGVAIDTQNNIIVAGSDSTESRIYKYDSSGTHIWNTSQGWAYGANNQYIMDVETDQSDNIYAVGGFYNVTQNDFVGAVKQYDSAGGALLWEYAANNLNMTDTGFNAADTTGAFIVATGQGWFNVSDPGGAYVYYTIKLDASGTLVWNATHSEVNANSVGDKSYGVAINGIGEIAVTGVKYLLATMQQNASIGTIKYNPNDVSMPYTTEVIATQSGSNINCYVNATDLDDVNLTAYYYWAGTRLDDPTDIPTLYSNPGLFGKTNITNGTRLLVSSVSKSTFAKGYSWRCYAKAFDGSLQQPLWSSSDAIELAAACGDTLSSDTYNFLTADVNTSGTCFTVTGDNVTLDCKGYAMRGDRSGSSDNGFDYSGLAAGNVTIKNCIVYNFSNAISGYVRDTIIYNNSFISPGYYGISITSYGRNNITSNNFTSCSPTGGSSYATIYIQSSSDNYMANNYLYNNTGYDIYFSGNAYRNRIINNTIDVANRNKSTIYNTVGDSYTYFENNSIINQGTGTNSWALSSSTVAAGMIFVGNNSVGRENLSDACRYNLSELIIDNTTKGSKNLYNFGLITAYQVNNIVIKNSVFRNHSAYGINLYTVNNVTIINNSISDATSSGYGISASGVSNAYIANNTIYNSTSPIYFISGINNLTVINNTINTTAGHAIALSSSATPSNINLVIENNWVSSSSGNAVYITASSALTNISVKNNVMYKVYTGIGFTGTNPKNTTIYNNNISQVSSAGISTGSAPSLNISFNTINCSSGTTYGINLASNSNVLVNNTISNCQQGLWISSSYNNITSNVLFNNTYYGIAFSPVGSYLRNNITHDNLINGYEPYYYNALGQPVTVENLSLKISNGVNTGVITIVDSPQVLLRNNTIMGNGSTAATGLAPCLGLGNITNALIENNMLNSTTSGIDIYSSYSGSPELVFDNNTIANNSFLNTSTYSIYLRDGGINTTIINNTFKYGQSYALYTDVNDDAKQDFLKITQNRIYNHSNIINLVSNKYTDIEFNDVANITSSIGIYLSGTEYVTIHDNNITGTGSGGSSGMIYMAGTAKNNSITSNYINNSVIGITWASPYVNNSAINNRIYGSTNTGLSVTIASTSITYAPQNIYNNTICYGAKAITWGSSTNFNLTKTHNNTFCTANVYPTDGATILGTRFNVTFNATNVFNTTDTNCTLFIDGPNNYGYNQTTQDKKNTTIEMASAVSLGAHTLDINCTDKHDNKNLPSSITFTADSSDVAPNTISVKVNSTYATNLSNENITCWTNITDPENSSLVAYYAWYNNSVVYSSGTIAIAGNTVTNISTLDPTITTYGENWTCEVRGWDGEKYEADWNNASIFLNPGCDTLDRNATLARNVSTEGTCLTINASNIALDCAGYSIAGSQTVDTYGVYLSSYSNITIKNCDIRKFTYGIYMQYSNLTSIINNTIRENTESGISGSVINNTLFENNTIRNNTQRGLSVSTAHDIIIKNINISNSTLSALDITDSENVTIDRVIGRNITGQTSIIFAFLRGRNFTITNSQAIEPVREGFEFANTNEVLLENVTSFNAAVYGLRVISPANIITVKDSIVQRYSIGAGNLTMQNSSVGKILFLANVDEEGTNLIGDSTSDIRLANNSVYVNSSQSGLNVSANVTFYNLGWTETPNVYIDRDDDYLFEEKCASPECEVISYDAAIGELKFNTTHFTNFTSEFNMPPYQDTPILNSTSGASAPDNANLTLYPQNATDPDNDKIINITNWFVNSVSLTMLNLPFDTNVSVSTTVSAKDYSPYNHPTYGGIVSGSYPVWISLGISGGAYNFSSAAQAEMQVNDNVHLNLSKNFTVELWARPASIASSTLIGKTAAANENFQIEMDNQGYVLFRTLCAPDVVGRTTNSTTQLTADNWYHIVGVHNDSNDRLVLFINGVQENYSTNYADMGGCMVSNYLTIGAYSAAANSLWWNGTLDEIRIYNRSLSPEQILINYNSGQSNYLVVSGKETVAGETWYADVTPNDGKEDGAAKSSNIVTITEGNAAPNTVQLFINSTYGTNYTNENITCWANMTDDLNTSLIAYFNWHNQSVLFSSGTTAVTASILTNISTIDSSLTTTGENWTCEVKGWDGLLNETDWNNATINITNSLPNITQVFTNSSQGMNFTDEDLTCWAAASDLENTSLVVYYNWYNRSLLVPELSGSTAVTSGVLTAVSTLDHSYTFNDTWKCEVRAWDGTNNETNPNNATEINVSICGPVARDFTLTENRDRNITSCLNITANNTVLDCDYHLIKGNITKSGANPAGDGGIGAKNGYNITIKYCNVTGFRYGVMLNKSNTIMFVNNSLINNSDGLFIDDSYGIDVIGNVINNQSRKGIVTNKMNHTRIINNTIDYNNQYGIDTIQNIINITIENNSVRGTQTFDGIYLQVGRNITIANNIIYNNDDYAIDLVRTDKLSIINNIIDGNDNSINSIIYYACNSTTIHNNTIVNNTNEGIIGSASPATNVNTLITNNTVLNNGREGIELSSSNNTVISGNIIQNNAYPGIYVSANNLSIYNNSISSNADYGISLSGASYIFNISDNIINNNDYYGIYIEYNYIGNISYNRVFNNSQGGIFLSNTANNKIWDNSLFNNTMEGIYFEKSENLSIINNSISNNLGIGISSEKSNYANISGNNIADNTDYGIYFFLSNASNITSNSISFTGGTGILLNHTIYNRIFQNTIWNNTRYGIGIENGAATNTACPEYTCGDGSCIVNAWVCDGGADCPGGEDEVGCGGPLSWNKVINNTLYNNSIAGIVVVNTDNETIVNNTVLSCGYYGILLNDTVDSNITRNTVKDHTYSIYLDSSSRNFIYDNYFENEPLADSSSTANNWNISKTLGTNIINGPYLGGNYWAGYNGSDTVGHDGLGDTEVPWTGTAHEIINGGDERPLLMRPDTLLVLVNSSFGTNYTNENITCWANLTDPTNTSLVAYFNWYNNSVLYSSGSTAVSLEILTNISTIDSSLTTIGENWTCEVKAWDGTDNETNWNNASLVIDNSLPNITQIIVNSTFGTNYDNEDITCWANATDLENTSLIVHFNWYTDAVLYSSGRAVVTANAVTNVSTIDNSLTTVGENWTCEAKAWDGTDNETNWNNASVVILAIPVTATTGGGGGGGGATRIIYGGVNRTCTESWICTPMSECIGGTRTRVCSDLNSCGSEKFKPITSLKCEVPKPEPPVEQVVVPEIKAEVETPEVVVPSLFSRVIKTLHSGLITAKKGLIIAFAAVEGFLWALPGLIMQNLCFILMLATYITLILAAVCSIIYFLTRNYFENMNKYFGISYVLIALAGLFLMANFVVCRELLTPALLAIAGIVGVFVLDTIVAGVVRHGVDYWIKIKHRQSYESLGSKFKEIADINRQLDKRWKKEFEKPAEIRIGLPKEGMLKSGLRKTLGEISKFNYSLKRRIESVQLPVPKKPEFRLPVFEPRVDYSGARELNRKIADIGRRIDSELREAAVKPKIERYPELKVEKKKKDIFRPLRKSLGQFKAKIFKIEKSAGIGLRSIVKSGEKKFGKAVEFNARKAFVKVARTDESIAELRKKIDSQLSDSWKGISQVKSRLEESRKRAVEEAERKKRQKEFEENRAVEKAERQNRQKELEEKRAEAEKARLEIREQLRKDLEERLKKKKFNSLVAREKSMIERLSSGQSRARIKEDADLGKTISSVDRFNGLLKKKIDAIKPVVGKEQKASLELSRNAEERINRRVSVEYQLALAQAMVEKRRKPMAEMNQAPRTPRNDPEANAVKKTVTRVDRFNELLKKKIDFVKRRKK